jgi:alkanesulfonate monooxygenase SsuD/methylene tetrahydromethanopterin reductase-like flavin-dependent oxidoreductase (luciferase family)
VAATLQDLSAGRFVLGVGAGVPADEAVLHGAARPLKDRFEDFAQTVAAVRALWSGASSWSGSRIRVEGVDPLPLVPGQESPHLMISAHGPRGYDLVARHGDGWSSYGGPSAATLTDAEFWTVVTEQSQDLTSACERVGRDPGVLRRSVLVGYGTMQPLASEQAYVNSLERAAQAGYDEVVVYWPWPNTVRGDRFWADPEMVASAVARAQS